MVQYNWLLLVTTAVVVAAFVPAQQVKLLESVEDEMDELYTINDLTTVSDDSITTTPYSVLPPEEKRKLIESLEIQYMGRNLDNQTTNRYVQNLTKQACKILEQGDPAPDNYCTYFFDQVSCWLPTKYGTKRTQRWPEYLVQLPNNRSDATVSLECLPNGKWDYNSTKTAFYALYGKKPKDKGRQIDQIKIFIYVTQLLNAILYTMSFLSLIAALGIFTAFKKLHCRRNFVHMHLFASFCLRAFFCIVQFSIEFFHEGNNTYTGTNGKSSGTCISVDNMYCKIFAMLYNYSFVANYFWILVEGAYLHNIIYLSVFIETEIKYYVLFGWAAPWLVIIPWTFVKATYDNCGCWIRYGNTNYMWIIRGPVSVVVIVNFLIFANIVHELYSKLKMDSQLSEGAKYRKLAKSTLVLTVLLGVHFLVVSIVTQIVTGFDPSAFHFAPVFVAAVETTISSAMGFIVATIYCFCNTEVRLELSKRWKLWQIRHKHGGTIATTAGGGGGSVSDTAKRTGGLKKCQSATPNSFKMQIFQKRRHSNSCADCRIREMMLGGPQSSVRQATTVGKVYLTPWRAHDSTESTTLCSTVASSAQASAQTSAQSSLNRMQGAKYRKALSELRRRGSLTSCLEEMESSTSTGGDTEMVTLSTLQTPANNNSISEEYVTCTS